MSIFEDDKFKNLDWISQITETIESRLNVILANLPDEYVVDFLTLKSYYERRVSAAPIDITDILKPILIDLAPELNATYLSWDEERKLASCFNFEVSDEVILNFEDNSLVGELKLVKVKSTFEDEELQKMMGHKGLSELGYISNRSGYVPRINEILKLIDAPNNALKTTSFRNKNYFLKRRLSEIFQNNEWRIRDMELANKICEWCSSYIKNGDLAAFKNLCKLKIMTHNNMPIYSVKEEE